MSPLLAEFLGAVVRWLLTAIGAALVANHVITAEQSERFSLALADHLVVYVLPLAASLAWSLWHKYVARVRLRAARELPAGADDEQLADRMRDLLLRPGE